MSYIVMIEVLGRPRIRVSADTLEHARRLYDAIAAQHECVLTLTGPDGVMMATRLGGASTKTTAKA
ncbi:hypothetical protein ACFFLM_24670 [Deinococcus oregonensis]|uniref:Uncharacterized protein n=1 Tax=Deinococcus oregonensis TaxID=1805970 RepID=A0ABV6B5W7_9DEIO